MKTAIIVNHSYNGFIKMAETLKKDLSLLGCDTDIITNKNAILKDDKDLDFDKCVFFDKDVPLGLRLEMSGIRLYNNIGSIELCDDKRRTYELLRKDFPTPLSYPAPLSFSYTECADFFDEIETRLGFPLIAKFAYGSLGNEVFLLHSRNEAGIILYENYTVPHLYQKFINESAGKDLRVYVVAGKARAAVLRENKHDFRANICPESGTAVPFELTENISSLCENASFGVGLDFCGVDILFSDNGLSDMRSKLKCHVHENISRNGNKSLVYTG